MKNILPKILLSATLMSSSLFAVCNTAGCNEVTVKRLYALDTNDILIETSGDESLLGCTTDSHNYITLENTNASKNIFFSLLLTAQTTNQKIYISVVPGSTNCAMAYMYTI